MTNNSQHSTPKYSLIKKPLISEKATKQAEKRKFVFVVSKTADKLSVKRALEKLYEGLKIVQVNMVKSHPKTRRFGRSVGALKAFKKAIVTLSKDSKLPE